MHIWWYLADVIFTLIFCVELAYRKRSFCGCLCQFFAAGANEMEWNRSWKETLADEV